MRVVKGQELIVSLPNYVGQLQSITGLLQSNSINIRALNAWVQDNTAWFRLVTSDNAQTKKVLEQLGPVSSQEVVIAEIVDEIGGLHQIVSKIKDAGIDLVHMYGTAYQPGQSVILVFATTNNNEVVKILSPKN